MRFASIPKSQQPQRTSAAADFVRRIVSVPAAAPVKPQQPAPARADLPADLDQRVRLVGEW